MQTNPIQLKLKILTEDTSILFPTFLTLSFLFLLRSTHHFHHLQQKRLESAGKPTVTGKRRVYDSKKTLLSTWLPKSSTSTQSLPSMLTYNTRAVRNRGTAQHVPDCLPFEACEDRTRKLYSDNDVFHWQSLFLCHCLCMLWSFDCNY